MSLLIYYESGLHATSIDISDRIENYTLDIAQQAEEGAVAISSITIDDPDGNLDVVGWRRLRIHDNVASVGSNSLIANLFITDRRVIRGPYETGAGRQWVCSVVDMNVVLDFRVFTGSDANRPAETDVERIQWVMTTSEVGTAVGHSRITDSSLINTAGPVSMDAADYRGQKAADVINDCAQASGKNYFVWTKDGVSLTLGLWYDFASSTAYTSDIKLTNVLSDVEADPFDLTVAIADDTELTRDPARVYSGAYIQYDGGAVYEQNTPIADLFVPRDALIPAENVKTSAKATARANRVLAEISTEEDRVTTAIRLPSARVNFVNQGQRVQFRATHLPGYEDYSWTRVLKRKVLQDSEESYLITLDLSVGPPGQASGGELAFRQSNGLTAHPAGFGNGSASLPAAPLVGSLILLQVKNTDSSNPTPTGFTDLFGSVIETTAAPSALHKFRLWYRIAQAGDTATYLVPGSSFDYTIAEWTGGPNWTIITSDFLSQQGAGASDHPHKTLSPVHTGEILVVGALIHNNTLLANFAPDSGWTTTATHQFTTTVDMGMVHRIETNTGSYDPGVSTAPFLGGYGAGAVAFRTGA